MADSLGKFFAAFTLFAIMLVPTLIYQLVMAQYSDPVFRGK
jgi:hypothetical protein